MPIVRSDCIAMGKTIAALAAAAIAAALVAPAYAIDGASVVGGRSMSSHSDVDRAEVALQWSWARRWLQRGNWYLGGYWELDAGSWANHGASRSNSGLWDIGMTPVFRVQQAVRGSVSPYVDWAIGAHLLSRTSVSAERRFSTGFQFGDFLGVGVRFGPRRAYDLSLRAQHFSNAGIKRPNNGIDFLELRLGYWF